jgi:hypothetical protein
MGLAAFRTLLAFVDDRLMQDAVRGLEIGVRLLPGHDFRLRAIPRSVRSTALFVRQIRPSLRKRVNTSPRSNISSIAKAVGFAGDAAAVIFVEVFFQRVMAWHLVFLAALLVQATHAIHSVSKRVQSRDHRSSG